MTDASPPPMNPRDRVPLLNALRAGTVPARGLHLIQVGRKAELQALIRDLDHVASGGAAFRIVVGPFGSGKTFLLNLTRAVAREKKLVTVHADLTPDRRLHATGGEAQALYRQLMVTMATRTKPEGGALEGIVERFVISARDDATTGGVAAEAVIRDRLRALHTLSGDYDFAEVVARYWRGHESGDDLLRENAVRWLRGEFSTKTDARTALGVRTFVNDASVLDQWKLLARFVRLAGFAGLVVVIDEMVNLFKLGSADARKWNYERLLGMLNDCHEGTVEGLGFVLGGTPEFVMDPRKGLFSYEALRTRLAENQFAKDGLIDFSGPVINLAPLTPEDLVILFRNLRHVHAQGDTSKYLLPDEAIRAFLGHCARQIGAAYFRTPRDSIKAFLGLLDIVEQNPEIPWQQHLDHVHVERPQNPDPSAPADENDVQKGDTDDDGLSAFRL